MQSVGSWEKQWVVLLVVMMVDQMVGLLALMMVEQTGVQKEYR